MGPSDALRLTRPALFLLLPTATAACRDPGYGCDVCLTTAVVYGEVTDTAGAPLAAASVRVEAFRDTCAGTLATGGQWAQADGQGRYRELLISAYAPFDACVDVAAARVLGNAAPDTTATGARVRFGSTPRDSLRVDLVLP